MHTVCIEVTHFFALANSTGFEAGCLNAGDADLFVLITGTA